MNSEIENIIKEQMKILPVEVIDVLASPAWTEKILNIGKKNGLNEEELGTLQLETSLVMLGLTHPDSYVEELKNHLKVSEIKTDNIVNEINRELSNGIREKLISIFNDSLISKEEIKKNIQGKKTTFDQNLNFILSGGDYTVFLEDSENTTEPQTNKLIGTSNIIETKNKLLN